MELFVWMLGQVVVLIYPTLVQYVVTFDISVF